MSRQIIDSRMKAGGVSPNRAINPKPSQYSVTINRNMLPDPGAIGSISHHSMVMSGDCQSPRCQSWI